MTERQSEEETKAVEHLLIADFAMWAGDVQYAEKVLLKLVRPNFMRRTRIVPQSPQDWAQRTAEARLRQLYYCRGRDRKIRVDSNPSMDDQRRAQQPIIASDSLRVMCYLATPESLMVRGYLTDLDPANIDRIFAKLHTAMDNASDFTVNPSESAKASSGLAFRQVSESRQIVGRFQLSRLGSLSGTIFALPSIKEKQKAIRKWFFDLSQFINSCAGGQ